MNIYVGNLSGEVTENDLRQAFESFGQVESVNLLKDRISGESAAAAGVATDNQS